VVLHGYVVFSEGIIQGYFFVGTILALANNQGTGYIVFSCRKLFGIGARDNHGARGNFTAICDGLVASNVDDAGTFGEYYISAQYGLSAYAYPLYNN
jgi:hypothetical protein